MLCFSKQRCYVSRFVLREIYLPALIVRADGCVCAHIYLFGTIYYHIIYTLSTGVDVIVVRGHDERRKEPSA